MSNTKPQPCVWCHGKTNRVYSTPAIISDARQPKTVGELANRNTEKKVARGQLSPKALEAESRRKERAKLTEHYNDLNKMTAKQKRKYILEGKK